MRQGVAVKQPPPWISCSKSNFTGLALEHQDRVAHESQRTIVANFTEMLTGKMHPVREFVRVTSDSTF